MILDGKAGDAWCTGGANWVIWNESSALFGTECLFLNDPSLRKRTGRVGRKNGEEYYSIQVWDPRLNVAGGNL